MILFVRSVLFRLGYVAWTAVLAVPGLLTLVCGRRAVVLLSRLWAWGLMGWLRIAAGITHEVRGLEHLAAGPAIIALKHQAAWETLLLPWLLDDPAIVFKRELGRIPFVGWYINAAGMIPVDRQGGATALRGMIARAKAAIETGRSVAIFPEGTRGPVGASLPYQPGVAALYSQLGVPMLPVALNSGLFWDRSGFWKRPGRIILEFLPPIPAGLDRRAAMQRLEREIEAATSRLIAEAGTALASGEIADAMNEERTIDDRPMTGKHGDDYDRRIG